MNYNDKVTDLKEKMLDLTIAALEQVTPGEAPDKDLMTQGMALLKTFKDEVRPNETEATGIKNARLESFMSKTSTGAAH